MDKKDVGIAEIRRVFYEMSVNGEAPTVRDVFPVVGGHYNTVATLVREVSRERTLAQTVTGSLPEAVQNPILALLASLVTKKEEIIRKQFGYELKMHEDTLEQLRKVESLNSTLEGELARLKVDHERVVQDLQVKLLAKTENNAAFESKCAALERDKEDLIRSNEACRSEANLARAELHRIEGAAQTLEKQYKEKETLLADTQLQLAEARTDASVGKALISEMQLRVADLEKTCGKLDAALFDLDSTRKELHEAHTVAKVADAKREGTELRISQLEELLGSFKDQKASPSRPKKTQEKGVVLPAS